MVWKITFDVLNNQEVHIGAGAMSSTAIMPYEFRLLDDDGEVYYLGYSSDNNSEAAFEPLNWGMNDSGCTEIQYRNSKTGEWETL